MSAGITNKCSQPGAQGRNEVRPGFAGTVRSGFQAKPHSRPRSLCSSSLSAQHVYTGISVLISRPTVNIHLTGLCIQCIHPVSGAGRLLRPQGASSTPLENPKDRNSRFSGMFRGTSESSNCFLLTSSFPLIMWGLEAEG